MKKPKFNKKKKLSFKEQKEQDLLSALDDVYEQEDREKSRENRKKSVSEKLPKKIPSTNQKSVVYIDGENAFFQIFDELKKAKLIKLREDLVKFDLKMLLNHMLGDLGTREDKYYGAKLHEEHDDPELLKRTQKMIDHKRRWIGYLSNIGVEFIAAGKLVIRPDINPITKKHELVFNEKGVDVSLAVDIVEAAASKSVDTLVLWSSDQDLKPAMLSAEKHEIKVIYLTHEDRINDVMTGSASETRLIPSDLIKKAFKKAN